MYETAMYNSNNNDVPPEQRLRSNCHLHKVEDEENFELNAQNMRKSENLCLSAQVNYVFTSMIYKIIIILYG